jgi:arsenite methyltransferase
MSIVLYCATDEQQHAADALAAQLGAELAATGTPLTVTRVADAGIGEQDLPLTVVQVMALKGADTFPLTLVGDNAAHSGSLPEVAELRRWAAEGLAESVALVTDATAFIEATYEQLAQLGDSGLCCSPIELYSAEELALLPDEILRLSSGCGHPVEDATITAGMTVLDIGAGAGADAILAARRTGPTGAVIGVDPSESMRQRATRSAQDLGMTWIEFRAGTAESLPVADRSVDLAISNCVLSLSTDPTGAWAEIARTLRPGGQTVVSDIVGGAATETLDAKARCETGVEWADYQTMLTRLGFSGIRPLRVRAARYRDGNTARSVTIHARHGLDHPHVAVDLIHLAATGDPAGHRAEDLADSLRHLFGERVSVRLLNATDPAHRDIVALLHDSRPEQAAPTVAVNGRTAPVSADDLPAYLRDLLE